MFAIVGASGNTGRVVAGKLLEEGKKVRVIGRDPDRLKQHTDKGGEIAVANVLDPAELTAVFTGAKAVYLMIPPNPGHANVRQYQEQVNNAMATAVEEAKVEYAVVLSSIGADKLDKTGPVVGLYDLEQRLNRIAGLNAVFLRAGYFMENLLPQIGIIQNFGMLAGPLRSDLKVPMISTHDIGIAAAEALLKLSFTGKETRELLGQRDVSYQEAASVIGQAIGRPELRYMQLGPEQLKPALVQMGMSQNMADLLLEMSEALNSGYMRPLEPRSELNTTPTSLETFVAEHFVPRFTSQAAGA
jgi:uncharacterized protein YbjT (DUF2867 family)